MNTVLTNFEWVRFFLSTVIKTFSEFSLTSIFAKPGSLWAFIICFLCFTFQVEPIISKHSLIMPIHFTYEIQYFFKFRKNCEV